MLIYVNYEMCIILNIICICYFINCLFNYFIYTLNNIQKSIVYLQYNLKQF